MTMRRTGPAAPEMRLADKYLEIAGGIVIALDAGGKVVEINRSGAKLLGFPKTDIIGKNWFDNFIPERIREQIRSDFKKRLTEDLPTTDMDSPVLVRNGKELMFRWRSLLLHDKRGGLLGILSSGEDVTACQRRQEASNQYRDRLESSIADRTTDYSQVASKLEITSMERDQAVKGLELRATMLENIPEPIFLVNLSGNLTFVNEAATRVFEFDRNRLIGSSFWDLVQPHSKEVVEAAWKDLLKKRDITYNTYFIKQDGTRLQIEVHSVIIKTPDGEYIMSIVHNIPHAPS